MRTDFDVLIVGAGLSGIGAACRLETGCPGKTYLVLEGRERLGGTWDLFRYPGIRSDSDMYTLGYPFRPWSHPDTIADGAAILAYIRDTAAAYGVDRHIRYRQRVIGASWSSADARWVVEARDGSTGTTTRQSARFLYLCAGYYDYEEGYTPVFPGRERFRGRIVHPQKWPADVALEGKRVVVIGSGATAVTLVPALAERAAHVTMLQRSPSYILDVPRRDRVGVWLRRRLGRRAGYRLARWKSIVLSMGFYEFCRRAPRRAHGYLVRQAARRLGGRADVARDFVPRYRPWDQRLCVVPDGNLFAALRSGRASVVTDTIAAFTEAGVRLASGRELAADLVVTATGLELKVLGGVALEVDGVRVEPAKALVYKGLMLSDMPNLAFAAGYTNASWTLKCDLTSRYLCRLLRHMDRHHHTRARPRLAGRAVTPEPLIGLSSGYVLRAIDRFPRQGSRWPWKLFQNYLLDLALMRMPLDDGVLEFG